MNIVRAQPALRGWSSRVIPLLLALGLGGCLAGVTPEPASGKGCDRFASPRGSDHSRGSRRRPFRTVQRLADRLRPGQVGCLRRGTYRGDVKFRRHGTRKRRIVVRSYPGEGVRVLGLIWVSRRASYLTIRGLYLDGRNTRAKPSPVVNAHDVRFVKNDVTNEHSGICFILGNGQYGPADRARILRNRIHACGRLPRTNFDHGVYVATAHGVKVDGNWIYDNADYGVHLYPNAQGTLVTRNVIFGNGEGLTFSGDDGLASNDNVVERNVIGGSLRRFDVEEYWPDGSPVGTGNVLRRNCLGPRIADHGGLLPSPQGFSAIKNVFGNPRFADLKRRNFRILGRSRCAAFLRGANSRPGPPQRPPPPR